MPSGGKATKSNNFAVLHVHSGVALGLVLAFPQRHGHLC